ncbi:MAG: hypothetical protein WCH34_12265 [Bacteroidota bacterium]
MESENINMYSLMGLSIIDDLPIIESNSALIQGTIIISSISTTGVSMNSFSMNNQDVNRMVSFFDFCARKERYLTLAIDNLLKKNEYLQLTIQFNDDLIDEDEFEEELEKNEDKYLIKMNPAFVESDFNIISSIIQKLNRNFSNDEISELFAIPFDKSNKFIQEFNKSNQKYING